MAPKGSKNALGNSGGRPPEWDLDKEADELLEWSLKEDSTSLYQFTDLKEYLAQQLSQFAEQNTKFSLALRKAKERIGIRRERGANIGTIRNNVWERYAPVYDTMLHEFEDKQKAREAELKKNSSPIANIFLTTEDLINRHPNASKDLVNEANS